MAMAPAPERRVLQEVIFTIGSSLELDEVLGAIARLLSDASGVHACFVYFVEDGGERLVLRAASDPYAHLAGKIALQRGEGLAWWVAERREPAFIRENALADSRVKYIPELEEERFQSLCSVPIIGRAGVIGVISANTEAPREFTDEEVQFLFSSASLLAGAIENARRYERMRSRVRELEDLRQLGETIARAETHEDLLPAVTSWGVRLLRAKSCHLYVLDPSTGVLRLRLSNPPGSGAEASIELWELDRDLPGDGLSDRVTVPLVANNEVLGALVAEGTSEVNLAREVGSQAAVAIKKIDLIERLREKSVVKDFFEQLAGGPALGSHVSGDVEARARRLGCDLAAPHLVLMASAPEDRLERELRLVAPGSLCDRRDDSMRALLRVPPSGETCLVDAIRRVHRKLGKPIFVGVSSLSVGASGIAAGFAEARYALLGTSVLQRAPDVMTYEDLGPYKYLLRMSAEEGSRDGHQDAVARLAEYDRKRSTSLLPTLEQFMRCHGNIIAASEALIVHENTVRQRLRRIEEVSGLDLRREDWLPLEMAVKMWRLREAPGTLRSGASGM
jgi:putative methionine-R-sulfoxide reductase with GAF domain